MRAQVDKLASAMANAPAAVEAVPAEVEAHAETRGPKANPAPAAGDAAPVLPDRPSAPARPSRSTAALQPAVSLGGDLRYAYVLIPRLPTHRLEGDLAEKLAAWLPQLCLAFAWRLEHLSIQPGFVQWMVSIPPDASPDSVAHTLDVHLSERIFAEFPALKRDNPSGHFFAPGFFVSTSLPEADKVSDYIRQTRNRQGIPNQE
jgi:REP element-mobilizing transposase RayT